MPSVRITTDWQHPNVMEWAGAPAIDSTGHIARSIEIPEEAFDRIEKAIASGHMEGVVYLKDRTRFQWFLDR